MASVPYAYNVSAIANGWGDPTNIFFHDGYYYVAAWNRNSVGLQSAGTCFMRTATLLDPTSWRGWNGSHYAASFRSPYNREHDPTWDVQDHICHVLDVDPNILDPTQCNPFGLVYSTSLQVFLMTWGCLSGREGFYLTSSTDLIHWSVPQMFYNHDLLPPAVAKNVTSLHYPSLMDASAPEMGDNNYYTIGNSPHLFWVSYGHSVSVDGRSAWATPLEIEQMEDGSVTATAVQ